MKKRIWGILLSVCMVLALLPCSAAAANVLDSGACGEHATYVITDDGVMTITGTGTVTKPMPDERYMELQDTVTKQVSSIVIGEGITAIADEAFSNPSYNLKSLTLPDSLVSIGNRAFESSMFLEDIRFGNSLKTIGNGAFSGCALKTLDIPETVTSLGAYAFHFNCYLTKATVPGSVKELKNGTFGQCSLTSVILEPGITTIGEEVFFDCPLTSIELPDTLTSIGKDTFRNCIDLEYISIPGSVKTIPEGLFTECRSLKVLVLEDGVETLAPRALAYLPALEEVYLPDTIRTIGAGAMQNCAALQEVRIPAGAAEIPPYMFSSCGHLQSVIVPPSVTTINPNAFMGCNALETIYYAGTEEQFDRISIPESGIENLYGVELCLIPAMPDPVFGLYDMPEPDNWAYPGVAFCLASGLMNGMGSGYFRPDGTTTRAQLVTILWRMMDEPGASQAAPFTDLTQDWYRDAVAWAAENNITNGTSATTFSPDTPVTREQMVTIFYRMCRDYLELDVSPAASLAGFPDSASVSPWAKDALQWGVAVKLINGVASGSSVYLQPQGSATRAQIATVMRNFVSAFSEEFDA